MTIKSVKAMTFWNEKIWYCPDCLLVCKQQAWLSPKEWQVLTLTEKIELATSGKKNKHWVKLFCKICEKFKHTTADCFKNPINQKLDDILQNQNIVVASEEDKDGDEGYDA